MAETNPRSAMNFQAPRFLGLKRDFQPVFRGILAADTTPNLVTMVSPRVLVLRHMVDAGFARGRLLWGQTSAMPNGHDVSGATPPSRLIWAQHSRTAVNTSTMAALIFRNS